VVSAVPNPWHQLLYLGGARPVPSAYRDWLQDIVSLRRPRLAGARLASPNAAMLVVVGIFLAVIGDLNGFGIFFGGALLVVVAGAGITPFARRRARAVAAKNGLSVPLS